MASGWRDFETWDGLAKISGVPLKCHAPAFPTRTARVSRKGHLPIEGRRPGVRYLLAGRAGVMPGVSGRRTRMGAAWSIRPRDDGKSCMEYPAEG